jgi:uncharacterized protein
MLYAIYCKDKPNHLQTRLDNRPAHVDYLKQFAGQMSGLFQGVTITPFRKAFPQD